MWSLDQPLEKFEAQASRRYWPLVFADANFRRHASDGTNRMLNYGYTVLRGVVARAVVAAGLHPALGLHHHNRYDAFCLADDLMEPFRPLISDSIAISVFNRGELKEGHFSRTAAGCMLTNSGRKAFFANYGRRMAEEVTHPVFGYRLSYRRMIILHARMIAAWLTDEISTLAFLTTR